MTLRRTGSAIRNSLLYEQDFYAWTNEQAALLRGGQVSDADLEPIAEEIESKGRCEKRELISRLKVLLTLLLKWQFQPTLRGTSWRLSIEEQRREVAEHLADNPSLKAKLPETVASAYAGAILVAARETGVGREVFPPESPWQFDLAMSAGFWPGARAETQSRAHG